MTAPPPTLTVSEWADNYRRLSNEYAPEPGQWRTERAPYQRELMDCSADPRVRKVSIMAAAQTGKTELELNVLGRHVHMDPCSILWVWPTEDLAQSFSKERFAPTVRDTPVLKDRIREAKSRDSNNTIMAKSFPGGFLAFVGANSPRKLASRPIRVLLMDEIDGYPASAGTEGDPRKLAEKRTTNFWNSLVIQTSTPTIKGLSPIESEYEKGTMERWHWQCPGCGVDVEPVWERLIFQGKDSAPLLRCPHCGKDFPEREWKEAPGRWIALHPSRKSHRSFQLSSLISPWISWAEIVEEFMDAKHSGGIQSMQVFFNTRLARTWDAGGASLDSEVLERRRSDYGDEGLPMGVLVLTAGVDVQDDRLEVEVVGWGVGRESWGVVYRVFQGDPSKDLDVWRQLDDFLKGSWSRADGVRLGISCACVDSGGHCTSQVYRFTRLREPRRVFAIKGRGGAGVPQVCKPTRTGRERAVLFSLGVDSIKTLLFARLRVEDEGPDYCHWPRDPESGYDPTYFDGLTSEQRVVKTTPKGRKVEWVKKTQKARNEPLDCRVYATAALEILNPNFERLAEVAASGGGKPRPNKPKVLSKGVSL